MRKATRGRSLRPETAAAVYDMRMAATRIEEAVAERTFADYTSGWMLQSAVERQFEIFGEAMVRIRDLERPVFDRFKEPEKIVGLRNVIIHGYDRVDPRILWAIATEELPGIRVVLDQLLAEAERQGL